MRKLLLSLLFILLTAGFASSLSVSSVTIPSSVTSGSSFSISATLTASDVSSTSVTLSGSPLDSAYISCTPTGSQTVSTSSDSGTATWSCTANTVGVYNNQLTISASGVDGEGNTKSDSTLTGTEVVAGAGSPAIAITSSFTGQSLTCSSQTAGVATVVISNPGTATATGLSWAASGPTFAVSFSCTTSTGSIADLAAGATKTITCTATDKFNYNASGYARTMTFTVTGTGISESNSITSTIYNTSTSCTSGTVTPPAAPPAAEGGLSGPTPTWSLSLSPATATLNPGSSKTISVDVSNTGTLQVTAVTVSATSNCASFTPASFPLGTVKGGEKVSYSAKITLNTNAVKGTTCYVDFKASPESGASKTISFAITVPGTATTPQTTPTANVTPSTRDDAISSLGTLNDTIAAVEDKINTARGSNANVTDAFEKLNSAKDLMERAQAALDGGDYDEAVRLAAEATDLLNQATVAATPAEKFQTASLEGVTPMLTRILMAIVALAAVLGGVYYVAPKLAQEISKKAKAGGGFKFTPKDQGKQLDLLMGEIRDKPLVTKVPPKGKAK